MHPAHDELPEGIARAVADRQDDVVGPDALAVGQHEATQAAAAVAGALDLEIRDPALEADLASQGLNRRAQVLHHPHQPEGADVGLAEVQDFRWRAAASTV
jgi:UDP-N-acetylmuramate-alanine ligase